MCDKKRINLHFKLENLPLDELYNSNVMEYIAFYNSLFSNFWDDYPNFSTTFGMISYDLAFGKWVYNIPFPDAKLLYVDDRFIDEKEMPISDFELGFLSKCQIEKLVKETEQELLRKPKKECTDYLYEAVKNHPYEPYYEPDCIY